MSKKYTPPTPEQEIESLRKDVLQELKRWQFLREHGGQDPFWPDGVNMNLIRNHIIYDKTRLLELCQDGKLPEEYYLPTPPEVDKDYLARKNKYFKERKKRIEEGGDTITTKMPPNVKMQCGELF